jgi:hypothetical protein
MSNLPGDFSADDARQGIPLPASVEQTDPTARGPIAHPAVPRQDEKRILHEQSPSYTSDFDAGSLKHAKVDDEDDDDDEDEEFQGGIKLRDLGQDEVLQFPGIKREKWWYVIFFITTWGE